MVRKVTFEAEAATIRAAKKRARPEGRSLGSVFRGWLENYAAANTNLAKYREIMQQLSHVRSGRKFPRDELNT
jgi:hypothetical protein